MNDRLKKILIAICVIALLLISSLAIYLFMASRNNDNEYDAGLVRPTALPVSQDKPEKTNEFDDIKIDLVDYYTFDLEDVDFNFIIATIRVKSNMSTNIGLEHFKTSEDILLSDYASYISILENKGYFLGKQNFFFELVSNELEYYVNIFIPVKDKALNNVSLTIDFGNNKVMNFDMNKKNGNKDMLTYVSDDVISDGKTYQLKVSSAYEITGEQMYQNGNEYLLPSTVGVYVFNVEAVSLWKDEIVIESATYVCDDSTEVFEALSGDISSMKHDNIIGKKITESQKGTLFFVAYSPMDDPITYHGILKLKISGSDNPVEVKVDLN